MPTSRPNVTDISDIVLQLQTFRSQYDALIHSLEGASHSPDDRDTVEERYRQRFQDWEEGQPVGHDEGAELQLEFQETIAPIWQLMITVRQALIVYSVASELGKTTLHAFDELAFVKHLQVCVRDQPYHTLQGLDTVIALFKTFEMTSKKSWPASSSESNHPASATLRGSDPAEAINVIVNPYEKVYKTKLGRNIDRLRMDCAWSYDELATNTEIDKTSILDHVNEGTRAHPSTLGKYAKAFTTKLGRPVTVEDLLS